MLLHQSMAVAQALPLAARPPAREVHTDTVKTVVVGRQRTSQLRIVYSPMTIDASASVRDDLPWKRGDASAPELYVWPEITIGGLRIPGGVYQLWATGDSSEATLVVGRSPGVGDPPGAAAEIGRIRLSADTVAAPYDRLAVAFPQVRLAPDTMGVAENKSGSRTTIQMNSGSVVSLAIFWRYHEWTAPVTVPDTLGHGRGPSS